MSLEERSAGVVVNYRKIMEAGLKTDERSVTGKERGMRQKRERERARERGERERERELTAPEVSSSLVKG